MDTWLTRIRALDLHRAPHHRLLHRWLAHAGSYLLLRTHFSSSPHYCVGSAVTHLTISYMPASLSLRCRGGSRYHLLRFRRASPCYPAYTYACAFASGLIPHAAYYTRTAFYFLAPSAIAPFWTTRRSQTNLVFSTTLVWVIYRCCAAFALTAAFSTTAVYRHG